MGIPKENTIVLSSGDVLELTQERATLIGKVQAQGIMVDGLGVGDVGNIVYETDSIFQKMVLSLSCLHLKIYKSASCRTGYCFKRVCLCKGVRVSYG